MKKSYADICLERAEQAEPGPWHVGHTSEDFPQLLDIDSPDRNIAEDVVSADAYFILHARTDVPELAGRLKKACEYLRSDAYAENLVKELEAMPEEKKQ